MIKEEPTKDAIIGFFIGFIVAFILIALVIGDFVSPIALEEEKDFSYKAGFLDAEAKRIVWCHNEIVPKEWARFEKLCKDGILKHEHEELIEECNDFRGDNIFGNRTFIGGNDFMTLEMNYCGNETNYWVCT